MEILKVIIKKGEMPDKCINCDKLDRKKETTAGGAFCQVLGKVIDVSRWIDERPIDCPLQEGFMEHAEMCLHDLEKYLRINASYEIWEGAVKILRGKKYE